MFKGIKAKLGRVAYGLAPMWRAAIMALFAVRDEAESATARQAAEVQS